MKNVDLHVLLTRPSVWALVFLLVSTLIGCHGELGLSAEEVEGCVNCQQVGDDDAGFEVSDTTNSSDATSPDAGDQFDVSDDTAICGNGVVEDGEQCDPCPTTCDDGNACTEDVLYGEPDKCVASCNSTPIEVCENGDGCCPPGCDASNDDDCSPSCGDGLVGDKETCDPPSSCPTSCDDQTLCTKDTMTGSAENCNVVCTNEPITVCMAGDGCCPTGCNETTDADCSATCGNDVIESGETCDGDCPSSCDDARACTTDTMTGDPASCDVMCSHDDITTCINDDDCCPPGCNETNDSDCMPVCGNDVVESGEECDGDCPSSCDDMKACTTDSMSGSASSCDVVCTHTTISACTDNDGCCPPGCDSTTDNDCAIDCRDPASWPTNWKTYEEEVVTLVNQERANGANCGSKGSFPATGPVVMDSALREAARCHSKDMATNDFFSHTGSDGSNFVQRANDAGYTGNIYDGGENIGAGYGTPSQVVAGWMASDGHCANVMKSSADHIGIGYVYMTGTTWTNYWTMVTGGQ